MLSSNVEGQRSTSPARRKFKRAKTAFLLLVEVAAVIGLLIAASELWQVRQALEEDLTMAKEVEAIIQEAERTTGAGERDGSRQQSLPGNTKEFSGVTTSPVDNSLFLRSESDWGAALNGGNRDG